MLLGAHVSSTGGIDTAVDRAEALRLRSIQIFSQSTRMWRQTNHTPEAIARFRERRAETGLSAVVIHATYLINLAATDDAVYAKSLRALSSTVGVGTAIAADGVVFHVGSHLGRGLEAAMHQIVPGLQVVLGERDPDGPWLLLENSAGHQGTIGVIAEGARADLLVVDGDPTEDLQLLHNQGEFLKLIMKDGKIFKNEL